MVHLVFCIIVWTFIFSFLSWRFIVIATRGIHHLKRLHQIPCDKCAYFTGDYRLKCTVNPLAAMSETAIDCRDFLYEDRQKVCGAMDQYSNVKKKEKHSGVAD